MTRKAIQILVHVSGVVWGSGHSQTVVRGSTIPTMHTLFWRGLDPRRDLMGRGMLAVSRKRCDTAIHVAISYK